MKIELNCSKCGSNRFSFPDTLTDKSIVTCADCGHRIGTLAELKDRVGDQVIKRAFPKSADRPRRRS